MITKRFSMHEGHGKMHRRVRTAATAIVGACVVAALGVGTAADGPASAVVNACHVSPIVDDLDRTARFYHELLGMDLMPPPPPGSLPVDTDPGHLLLHGMPGARLRFIQARIPGVRCGIELVELTNIDRHAIRRAPADSGSVTLVLTVRDLDSVFAALKRAGVPVVTTGGVPVSIAGTRARRAVLVQDPDGHHIELEQFQTPPQTTVAAASNVIAIGLRLTVADLDQAVSFYERLLDVHGSTTPFENDRDRLALAGLRSTGQMRTAMLPIPGSSRTLELLQVRGVPSAAAPSRVQDPGSYRLQLTFRDIDAALAVLAASGLRTISAGGLPVRMTFGGGRPWQLAIVPDPSNLFLIVQQAP
jgi:catechol 2,3-dioxygenase-like lactoylglutathione lyase family enzyme